MNPMTEKFRLFFAAVVVLFFADKLYSQPGTSLLRSGDLLFVADTAGMGAAIAAATGTFTHVAIVERAEDGLFVIEALPRLGVVRRSLNVFLNDNQIDTVVARRPHFYFDAAEVVSRAKSFLGQRYDNFFAPDNGMIYCSELVYECFIGDDGQHLFTARPMNFLAPDGTLPPYWQAHFQKLGCPVPQGELGTNPSDLFKEIER